jgi:hypothetical protein
MIIASSRQQYTLDKASVDRYVNERYNFTQTPNNSPKAAKPVSEATPVKTNEEVSYKTATSQITTTNPVSMGQAAVKGSGLQIKLKRKKRVRSRHKKNQAEEIKQTGTDTEHTIYTR